MKPKISLLILSKQLKLQETEVNTKFRTFPPLKRNEYRKLQITARNLMYVMCMSTTGQLMHFHTD